VEKREDYSPEIRQGSKEGFICVIYGLMEEISAWKCIAVTRVEAHGLIFSKSTKRIAQGSTTSQHSNEQHRKIK
jgi:hypothetical protein